MPSYYIRITVLSNYGNPDRISCSEIDILDSTNRAILVRDIQFEPPIHHYESPIHLVNSSLIKEEGDKEWSAKWEGVPFTIQLMVKTNEIPTNLRIWNSRMKTDECIKDVKVTLGEVFLRDATVPNNFGFIISLKTNSDLEKIQYVPGKLMRNHDDTAADRFGELPIRRASKLTIGIIETWEDSEFVGLNALKIVSIAGKVLSLDKDVSNIESVNCDVVSAPHHLFRADTHTASVGDIWVARKIPGLVPEISIEFKEPVRLSMITLSNALVRDFMQDFSAKKIRVSVDSIPVFYGTLKRAFSADEMEKSIKSIYFTDAPQLRRKAKVALMSTKLKL